MALQRAWNRVWRALNGSPDPALFDRLVAAYGEPHRHYHTLQHLTECVTLLERHLDLADRPGEVEAALWFHDAIYDVKRHDNEERSATWAMEAALAAGVAHESASRIHELVMATRHDALLARVQLYSSDRLRESLEAAARANLQRSIAQMVD